MFTRNRDRWLSLFISASLILTAILPVSVSAKRDRKPVVVSFGQPNIWSLEQAHYLLARMHMTNLDLQAKALSDTDLDPNATHGTRIDILKQLLDISGSFDQGIGFQNQRIVESARFNDDRRRRLTTSRDKLRDDSVNLELEINELKRERKQITDETSERAKDLDAQIEEKTKNQEKIDKEVAFQTDEIQKLGAEPSGTPTSPTVASAFDKTKLPSSILDNLTKDELEKLLEPGRDPKLNATTMLDNTVQLQYEIIAKQLTLLRDEVGPGERLVFLELPQSIYTTPDSGDEKMAQTWWHINGYTGTDPLLRLLLELLELEQKWYKIQQVPAYTRLKIDKKTCDTSNTKPADAEKPKKDEDEGIESIFTGLCKEHQNAREAVLKNIYREGNNLFSRVEQNGARDTSELVEAIRKLLATTKQSKPVLQSGEREQIDVDAKTAGNEKLLTQSVSRTVEENRRNRVEWLKEMLLKILSEDDPLNPSDANAKKQLEEFTKEFDVKRNAVEQAMEFVRLDEHPGQTKEGQSDIERRIVRAVDIIPRQSSLNVNDINETVKATGILAAFKFLFGFAGQVNYQRQREQYEQFLHQELYASGFGKGNRDFGWTFGALPGTKRVAPGVRTTYAALVVPEHAESLVLSARGCYFPRKNYQPLDFEDTGHTDWSNSDKFQKYNCGDQQTYILPIPGGGNTSNFWVTSVNYEAGKDKGEFVTVSVRGNNFSSQMGVLVDGIPLAATVGLAQPQLMPKKLGSDGTALKAPTDDCVNSSRVCGSYERIDSEQIVFSFRMPDDYHGIPTITLIGPGKAVDLNSLPGLRINGVPPKGTLNEKAFMFGARPAEVFSIKDLQLFNLPDGVSQRALLIGTKFDNKKDEIYVNGVRLINRTFVPPNLYELTFLIPDTDTVTVTIVQGEKVLSKTVANPAAAKALTPTLVSYEPAANNKPAVLVVKLEGLRPRIRVVRVDGATLARPPVVSATGISLRLLNPQPPVAIRLEDPVTGVITTAVVDKLPTAKEEPKPKPKEK